MQQGDGRHNHSSLAVAALGNILLDPGYLAGMIAFGRQTFDGGVALARRFSKRNLASSDRCVALVDGASSADSNSASVFRASKA